MDASGNKFGPEGGKAIAEALRTNMTIATITLSGKNDTTITVRADQLRQNTVDSLDFSNQGLHVDGATFVVAELLKSNSSVTKVSMALFMQVLLLLPLVVSMLRGKRCMPLRCFQKLLTCSGCKRRNWQGRILFAKLAVQKFCPCNWLSCLSAFCGLMAADLGVYGVFRMLFH